MNVHVPEYYVPKTSRELELLLSCIDYIRDGYCGGIVYSQAVGPQLRGDRFAVLLDDNSIWIDPSFFKKYVKD